MTAETILGELKALGKESYKKTIQRHGIPEPVYGVSVEALKKIQKRVKVDHQLALDLYASGIYDAMYLAGLIADDARMSMKDLQRWAETATCSPVREFTVAWVTAGSPHGMELALRWIDSRDAGIAVCGWATLGSLVSVRGDEELDIPMLQRLLDRVQATLHGQPDRLRYIMNGFVIAVGCFVKPLTASALKTAKALGKVSVDMGDTSCKVPDAATYIRKVKERGTIGRKRKTAKC
jgi:hypothetical protein